MTGGSTTTVRVELPAHLRQLARIQREATVTVSLSPGGEPVTLRSVLDALEAAYPMLEGTIRDHSTRVRRPFIRFFAGQEDLSHQCSGEPLPACILSGQEPLIVLGAIAGG